MARDNGESMVDAARTLRAIVQTEKLVADLESYLDMLRDLIEEERQIDQGD